MANKGAEWAPRAPPSSSRKRPRIKYSQDDDRSPPEWSRQTPNRQLSPWTLSTLAAGLRRLSRSEERDDSTGVRPLTPVTTPTMSNASDRGGIKIRGMSDKAMHLDDDDRDEDNRQDDFDLDSASTDSPKLADRVSRIFECLSALESRHNPTKPHPKRYADELRGHIADLVKDYRAVDAELGQCEDQIHHLQSRYNSENRENEDLRQDLRERDEKNQALNEKLVGLTQTKSRLACEVEEVKNARRREVEGIRAKHQQEVGVMREMHQGEVDGMRVKHQQEMEVMQEMGRKLQAEVEALEEEQQSLAKNNTGLFEQWKRQVSTIAEKDSQIRAAEALYGQYQELEKTCRDLGKVNEALGEKNKVMEESNQVLEKTNQELQKTNHELASTRLTNQEVVPRLEREKLVLRNANRYLQEQLDKQTELAACKEREAAELSTCTGRLRSELTGHLSRLTELRLTIQGLQVANAQLEEQVQKESGTNDERAQLLRDIDTLQSRLRDHLDEIKKKTLENTDLKGQRDRQAREAERREMDRAELVRSVESLRTQLERRIDEAIKGKKEKAELTKTIESLKGQLASCLNEVADGKREKESLQQVCNGLGADLHKNLVDLAKVAKETEVLEADVQKHTDNFTSQVKENATLRAAKNNLEAELTKNTSEVARLVKEKGALLEANRASENELKKSKGQLAKQAAEQEALRRANQTLEHKLAKQRSEVAKNAAEREALQQQVGQHVVQLADQEREKDSLSRALETLRQSNHTLQEQLEVSSSEAAHRKEGMEDLRDSIKSLREQLRECQKELAERNSNNADLARSVEALRKFNKSLEDAAEKQLAEVNLAQKEKAELERTADMLRQANHELRVSVDMQVAVAIGKENEKAEALRQVELLQQADREFQGQLGKLASYAEKKRADLLTGIENLRRTNQELQEQLQGSLSQVTKQEREIQELQGKRDILVSRERELEACLKVKDHEIETLKQQTSHHDDRHVLGSEPPSPFIKAEAPEPEDHTSAAPGPIPELTLTDYPAQVAERRILEPGLADVLQLYSQLGCGLTKLYYNQFGMGLISEPLHETTGTGNEVVVKYLTTLGGLNMPSRVSPRPAAGFWKMQDPWLLTPSIGLMPRSDLTERFLQLCFLVTKLRDQEDKRLLCSVANIVASLIDADHSGAPLAAAAFLQTMATLPPPIGGGIFRAENVALAILICELCRRLEQVFPDAHSMPWTIGMILGPAVQTWANTQPIGRLAAAIGNHDRNLHHKPMIDELERQCGDRTFCVISSSPWESNWALMLCCHGGEQDEGRTFLMIDFSSRTFRLVECRMTSSRNNELEPRKHDLIVQHQGQEIFRFPKAPLRVATFWVQLWYE
ncbi:hypothetical protein B0T16DRAFT_222330 [Cercophora newfieldiana]|uniref:Uncharacterized protein n=1 Tax=Cercophora newfieldiana TaxID=92897 RepID=A0AA39XZ28_9PEZI|nr:hypothetical protein B0T16DRAFT_222330 [Cercophora newfieldiana]